MRKNKRSFTLAEVLVSMAIIGFIMAMSMSTIKIVKTSYTALTYFTFKNIQGMVGEAFAGSLPNEALLGNNDQRTAYPIAKCIAKKDDEGKDNSIAINVLLSDYEAGESEQQYIPECKKREQYIHSSTAPKNIFCKAITGMLNVAGSVNCSDLYTATYDIDKREPYIKNLDWEKPNFITTNGQRYYLTYWNFDKRISDLFGYRLMAVDLNGKSRPNTTIKDSKNAPDIVTFLVLDNGEVFPLAEAADNAKIGNKKIQYINSQVKGYYYSHDETRKENVPSECFRKKKDGSPNQICNYAVVFLKQKSSDSSKETSLFTYREAYCNALGYLRPSEFKTYCSSVARTTLCPPSQDSKQFDVCKVENIKPLFRYNFK